MDAAVTQDKPGGYSFEQFLAGLDRIEKIQAETAQRAKENDERWAKQKQEQDAKWEKERLEQEEKWKKEKLEQEKEREKERMEREKEKQEQEKEREKERIEREKERLERKKEQEKEELERKEKLEKLDAEWREERKKTERIIGKLGNRFGELIEHLVAPNLMEKFNELGFHFDRGSNTTKIRDSETAATFTEIDIVLENDNTVIAVEVKAKPSENDVKEHIERMGILRNFADRKQDKRKYYGAIAGAIMGDAIRRYIIKTGFYLIVQSGDTVRIQVPNGFTPQEF